jgi:hypothetical protein
MGIKDSFNRWKTIILNLKQLETRLRFIEINLENVFQNKYLSTCNTELTYKNELRSKEYRVHSQNGEDGLMLYIFSQIGVTNQKFIEFGIGDGTECISANLLINFGWSGLMIEGSKAYAENATKYYNTHPKVQGEVKILNKFITKDNINSLFKEGGIEGEIDLLSIDIDGNDYWVWKEIEVISPRVVIIEYNATFGKEKALTVEYDPSFMRLEKHKSGYYHGASLKALEELGKEKGYHLIGCDSEGVNAIFIRNDINLGNLKTVTSEEAYYELKVRSDVCSITEQYNIIKHLPILEI